MKLSQNKYLWNDMVQAFWQMQIDFAFLIFFVFILFIFYFPVIPHGFSLA